MFCFKACFLSKHFWLSFLLSRFYFSVIFRRSRDQTKQTLAVTLLFQCNFLLLVGADNLIWRFYFYFYRISSKWCWINTKVFRLQHTFSLHINIPWDQLSKLYTGRVNCYMLIKYGEELYQSFRNRDTVIGHHAPCLMRGREGDLSEVI